MDKDILTAKIINKLFLTFQGLFPTFKQAWPTETEINSAKKEWVKAFQQVGLNDIERVKQGLEKLRLLDNPFVPSVGQFIEMCKKANVPEYHKEYKKLTNTCSTREIGMKHIRDILNDLKK